MGDYLSFYTDEIKYPMIYFRYSNHFQMKKSFQMAKNLSLELIFSTNSINLIFYAYLTSSPRIELISSQVMCIRSFNKAKINKNIIAAMLFSCTNRKKFNKNFHCL
jgi:hypothetical protein